MQQQALLQQSSVRQNRTARDLVIAGSVILLLFLILLYSRYRIKQRANTMLEARQKEINEKNISLQHIVEEKEWLLKEVHHRVKNNLHTVICLLESQAEYLESDALKALEVVQQRIFAMSLIHQKLYQSEEIKAIDMSAYVPEFIQYLQDSLGVNGRLTFKLDISPLKLGLSQAIPVALIINEAVTNAVKHAFPGNRRGEVLIFMHWNSDLIELVIADDGIGIDPAAMNNSSGTLGLKLIKGLSEDINATVHVTAQQGTRIAVLFSMDQIHTSSHENTYSGGSVYRSQ
jgi:two-component sensor histidine kinase